MDLLPLHQYPEYRESCADVLNEQWPRSKSARLHMLEKSNDDLPYSMVLIEHVESWFVMGHSRLCKVHGMEQACFVESVVIKKALRGKGFGRILMEKTEHLAKGLGYNTMYLTTHDKQDFYGHLGYEFCDPVVSLGGASTLLSNEQLQRLFGSVSDKNESTRTGDGIKSKAQKDAENVLTKTMTNSDSLSNVHELTIETGLTPSQDPASAGNGSNTSISYELQSIPVSSPLSIDVPSMESTASFSVPETPTISQEINAPPPPVLPIKPLPKSITRLPHGQIYWMKKNLEEISY